MTPTTMEPNQPQIEAINAAADVLETEANQLSYYIEKHLKTTTDRTGLVQDAGPEGG